MSTCRALGLIALLLVFGGTACSSGGTSGSGTTVPTEPVRLTVSGGCADAFLWATTPKGDLAVTVRVDADERSTEEPTTIDVLVPDGEATVEVLRGRNLARNFCNDVLDQESVPTSTQGATAGAGSIVLDPAGDPATASGCGTTSGTMDLTGLVAEDGTRFDVIDASTDLIGCYAG